MCGICGARSLGYAESAVRAMLPKLAHRGPDDEGIWTAGSISLGHRRLSIVDLSSAGHQPMTAYGGELALVANGEIYNYPDLRRELEASGVVFRSGSDSEVILHAYRMHGPDAFARLNGMFAFALIDLSQDRLFLVRDRMGIKPIYYYEDTRTGALLFASEIKAILAAAGRASWRIDPEALSQYLRFQNLFGSASLFAGIKLLPPGSMLISDPQGVRTETYWSPQPQGSPSSSFAEDAVAFHQTFQASVRRHLMSDVPVASYLSSGFDSTLVASSASAMLAEPPTAYTGTFSEGGWYDEMSGARRIAEHIGAPINSVTIGPQDLADNLDPLVLALDEPRMGLGAISQYMVAKAAAAHHKVILAGHGGDELFSGYPVFKAAALLAPDSLAGFMRILRSVRVSELPPLVYFLARRLFGGGGPGHLPVLFGESRLARGLSRVAREKLAAIPTNAPAATTGNSAKSSYEELLLTYLSIYLPGLLVVEDKISMAHALETRTPFLDNELVDLSLRISPTNKLHQGNLKAIIKQEARSFLPSEIFNLPKRGFPTPLAAWLRGPLKGWTKARLTSPGNPLTLIFEPHFLASEVERYLGSPLRRIRPLDDIQTHRMWMLLSLESWLRQTRSVHGVQLEL